MDTNLVLKEKHRVSRLQYMFRMTWPASAGNTNEPLVGVKKGSLIEETNTK